MLVLGIDPGTATTGYGLVLQTEDGGIEAVDFGVVLTSAKTPMPERLTQLYEGIREVVTKHRPDSSAVEELFFQKNVKTALSVSQGRGVAILALAQAGIPVAEYKPVQVKQAVVGFGGADKRQVQEMVRMLLDLEKIPKPDDAADALAVAICHVHSAHILQIYDEG